MHGGEWGQRGTFEMTFGIYSIIAMKSITFGLESAVIVLKKKKSNQILGFYSRVRPQNGFEAK